MTWSKKIYKHLGTSDRNIEYLSLQKCWELIDESPQNQEFVLLTREPLSAHSFAKIMAILHTNHDENWKKSQPDWAFDSKKPKKNFVLFRT